MNYFVLLGRILFAAIFIISGPENFSPKAVAYAVAQGVPLAQIAVPVAGLLAIAGGLSVLLGFRARIGGWLLVLFLVPVTVMMHRFWAVSDPAAAQIQFIMFLKNVSMLGGALLIAHFGSGPLSLDGGRPGR